MLEAKIPNSKQSFIVGDALNLKNKFSQNEFDVVFSIAVLHHLPSREIQLKVIKDCYNFLKPGGYFICTVWNLWQPRLIKKYKIWKILFGFRNVFISFKSRDNHSVVVKRYHYIFTRRELIKLFKKSGFKIIDSYYTRKGKKSNQFKGYNLTLIAQK